MDAPSLTGRRLLVTAGPTWVRIDAVRHIGNMSSGRTGLLIARTAAARGAAVTLLMGPGRALPTAADRAAMRVVDLVTYDDLRAAVRAEVGGGAYDAMIHTAAVSDFRPLSEEKGKLPSGEEELVIRLRSTPKIVDEVKPLDPSILLVKFKLEVGRTEAELLQIAAESRARSDAELVVANDLTSISGEGHAAYLLDASGLLARTATTEELADRLLREVAARCGGGRARDLWSRSGAGQGCSRGRCGSPPWRRASQPCRLAARPLPARALRSSSGSSWTSCATPGAKERAHYSDLQVNAERTLEISAAHPGEPGAGDREAQR